MSNASAEMSMTTLFVGDLESTVTEEELSQLFNEKGEVSSIKICIDQNLGYACVNYTNPQHAAKALEELNFTRLHGKCIRISYFNPDASLSESNAGNVFVKNLDKTVDHKALYDMFSTLGYIISSKVETNDSGQSKGYGFVQYENEEAAQKAIEQLNGVIWHGKALHVAPFLSMEEREKAMDKNNFTNVFVKNLSDQTTEEDLIMRFGEFGLTDSVAVMRDKDGNSKCFGFVNFENHEDAVKSVEVLHGKIFDGKKWYVARAQTKYEREQELKRIAMETYEKSHELNLYVKNLDDSIDDDKLKDLFSEFGSITSSKVLCDPKGVSKGSGFVAYSTSLEASRALSAMNGKLVGNLPLYVGIAEKHEDRKARLKALFSNTPPHTIAPAVVPHMPMHPSSSSGLEQQMCYGQAPPPIRPPMPEFGFHQQFVPGMRLPVTDRFPNFLYPPVQHGTQSRLPNGVVQHSQQPIPLMHQQSRFGHYQPQNQHFVLDTRLFGNGPFPNILYPPFQYGMHSGHPNGVVQQTQLSVPMTHQFAMRSASPNGFVQQSQWQVPMMNPHMLSRGNGHLYPHGPGYGLPNHSLQGTNGGMGFVPGEICHVQNGTMSPSINVGGLASALANASSAGQREILGEKLYPLVEQIEHEMADKVTGMLLEMDETEVIYLLESPGSLRAKVIEAVKILRSTPTEQLASLSLDG